MEFQISTQTDGKMMKKNKIFSELNYEKKGRLLKMNVSGIKTSLLNAMRRTIINDILNIGFGYEPKNTVTIKKNTTALHDEYLAHRIALIPVMIPKWIIQPDSINIDNYLFKLNVEQKNKEENKGYVTTDDIEVFEIEPINNTLTKFDNSKIFFPRDYIFGEPILITRFPSRDSVDQKLDIEFKLTEGTHSKHASFSPVTVCVCYEHEKDSNMHTFMLESIGIFTPYILIKKAIQKLRAKCDRIVNLIETNTIGEKYNGNYKAIEYTIIGESHTFGNMLQEFIYDKEFSNSLKGDKISHVSYHESHPLENKILFRLVLNEDNENFDSYKQECNDLMIKYINQLNDTLNIYLENWEEISINKEESLIK